MRYVDAQKASHGVRRWVSFCSWTRGELLGLLAVYALSLGASGVIFSGLASIGLTAAYPIAAISGNLGHPDALAYLADLRGRPAGDFVYALALQQAGELDQAAAIYEELGTPRAKNNLGVILAARGEAERARALFEQARAAEPGLAEAAHNLGEPSASERLERRRRYGVEGLLVALPTSEIWTDSVRVPMKLGDWSQFFGVVYQLSALETPAVHRAGLLNPASLLLGGYLLIALLAVVGLLVRAPAPTGLRPSALSRVGWGLGFVVPGTARQLSLLGPPLLALFAFSAIVKYFLVSSGGHATDAIEAVALTSLSMHGIGAMAYSPLQMLVRQTSELWWMILIVNLIVVVLLERRWPDPLGPRGRP
jgi:hypothetical protein